MAICVNCEMEFVPVSTGSFAVLLFEPFTFTVNLQASAIDQQMQRFAALNRSLRKCQAIGTAAERCVIRDFDVDAE